MILKIVRFLRALAWGFAATMAYHEATEIRYTLMHQDTAMQQGVANSFQLGKSPVQPMHQDTAMQQGVAAELTLLLACRLPHDRAGGGTACSNSASGTSGKSSPQSDAASGRGDDNTDDVPRNVARC